MPPCGSPLNSTTKSVPLPVSGLNASSATIREDRGAIQYVLRNDNAIERGFCAVRIRQHRLNVATTAPAHPVSHAEAGEVVSQGAQKHRPTIQHIAIAPKTPIKVSRLPLLGQ
jgi:hypothetical protein